MRAFDRTFGEGFLSTLPASPGVYLFRDADGEVVYVGKAKNLRRRLGSYRNATRRKAHRKMRAIVRAAASVEIRRVASDEEALLLENELIRALRPAFNVEGKFEFLYPALGLADGERHLLLCHTTDRALAPPLPWRWYGVFRSRLRARAAWESLDALLSLVGHADPREASRLRCGPCGLRAYRQVPSAVRAPGRLSGGERPRLRRRARPGAARPTTRAARGRRRAGPPRSARGVPRPRPGAPRRRAPGRGARRNLRAPRRAGRALPRSRRPALSGAQATTGRRRGYDRRARRRCASPGACRPISEARRPCPVNT